MEPEERAKLVASIASRISPRRMDHTLRVDALAVRLARFWGVSEDKADIAALLHDVAREESPLQLAALANASDDPVVLDLASTPAPLVLHAPVGAVIAAKDYGISDPEILHAIAFHTTGAPGMDRLAMIIFLGDYCEPGRNFSGVGNVRALLYQSLEASMLLALNQTVAYLEHKGMPVDRHTAAAAAYFARLVPAGAVHAVQP